MSFFCANYWKFIHSWKISQFLDVLSLKINPINLLYLFSILGINGFTGMVILSTTWWSRSRHSRKRWTSIRTLPDHLHIIYIHIPCFHELLINKLLISLPFCNITFNWKINKKYFFTNFSDHFWGFLYCQKYHNKGTFWVIFVV